MGLCTSKREGDHGNQPQFLDWSDEDKQGEPVYLNVYDLMIMNYTFNRLGLGIYHTGVQVYSVEYSYAGHYHTETTGLKASTPRDTSWLHDAIFREQILIGYTKMTRDEVRQRFEELKPQYLGPDYNVLDKNCNHFTQHFLEMLVGRKLPNYVNRVMKIAEKVRPCLPGMFTQDLRNQEPPPEYAAALRRNMERKLARERMESERKRREDELQLERDAARRRRKQERDLNARTGSSQDSDEWTSDDELGLSTRTTPTEDSDEAGGRPRKESDDQTIAQQMLKQRQQQAREEKGGSGSGDGDNDGYGAGAGMVGAVYLRRDRVIRAPGPGHKGKAVSEDEAGSAGGGGGGGGRDRDRAGSPQSARNSKAGVELAGAGGNTSDAAAASSSSNSKSDWPGPPSSR